MKSELRTMIKYGPAGPNYSLSKLVFPCVSFMRSDSSYLMKLWEGCEEKPKQSAFQVGILGQYMKATPTSCPTFTPCCWVGKMTENFTDFRSEGNNETTTGRNSIGKTDPLKFPFSFYFKKLWYSTNLEMHSEKKKIIRLKKIELFLGCWRAITVKVISWELMCMASNA